MFLKLVKCARITWRKRLWKPRRISSCTSKEHFLYVSMWTCSLCSGSPPWPTFCSLPTPMTPYTCWCIGHFSHTVVQGQSLNLSKARSPLSAYFWVSNLYQDLGIHSLPTQPPAVFHYPHCWSNLSIPCCCLNPTYLPHQRHGKQMASFHYALVLQISEGYYHLYHFPILFCPLNHPSFRFSSQHRVPRLLTTSMAFHTPTFVLKPSLQNQMS